MDKTLGEVTDEGKRNRRLRHLRELYWYFLGRSDAGCAGENTEKLWAIEEMIESMEKDNEDV